MTDPSQIRVLLIEDHDDVALQYMKWLRESGYQVERAAAAADGLQRAAAFRPDVVLLDLQIPSQPGRADEDVEHGFRTLDALISVNSFRPVVLVTAHGNRELTRRALQRTHGGQIVFKDAENPERALLDAVAVALASPAFQMSKTVSAFRRLIEQDEKEDVYRKFIADHWRVLLGPEYRECESPYPITRGGNIDILAVRHDGFPDLWELKRPSDPIFTAYGQWLHHSPACACAIGQLMEYYDAAEKENQSGGRHYDARHGMQVLLHRPRGFVVIGRYKDDGERERLRLENSFLAGLAILTYDDLIERAEQFLRFLQQYRNGSGTV